MPSAAGMTGTPTCPQVEDLARAQWVDWHHPAQ